MFLSHCSVTSNSHTLYAHLLTTKKNVAITVKSHSSFILCSSRLQCQVAEYQHCRGFSETWCPLTRPIGSPTTAQNKPCYILFYHLTGLHGCYFSILFHIFYILHFEVQKILWTHCKHTHTYNFTVIYRLLLVRKTIYSQL